MKKGFITFCALFILCLCFASCGKQPVTDTSAPPTENTTPGTLENETPSPGRDPSPKALLHISDQSYTFLPDGGEFESVDYEDLRAFVESSTNLVIVMDILGVEKVLDYIDEMRFGLEIYDRLTIPYLYLTIQYFDLSYEDLLEGVDAPQYDEKLLRAMYLPYDEMVAATLSPYGAYLDGNVHNIATLNELFVNDKDAFARINLDELVDYQERLEENGVDYGFNQDMVDFANENCARRP